MPEPLADAELVARSRRRDVAAFEALVERHQQLVFGVALARCHDTALAEDVAQEAFVTAWRDLERLRDVERVGSWVAGIARNLAASAVRARARRQDPPELVTATEVPTPEDEVLEREDRELLHRALLDVPEAHREALVLYYLRDESVAEIAAALGIREDLVKQRLSRGRKALRDSVAARVEAGLSRARLRPAFGAGVLAALATTAPHKAAAAGAAGKVIALMSGKQIALVTLAVLALAGGGLWLGTRAGTNDGDGAPPATGSAGATARPGDAAPAPGPATPRVSRLPDAAARTALLEAIRSTRERRTATTGSASANEPGAGPAGAPPALPEPTIDKQYIRGAVREIIPLLVECYEEGLTRDPALAGNVVVEFTIEGEPEVGGVIGESTIVAGEASPNPAQQDLGDPAVRECIQETMYALQIEPPPDGGVVRVRYPFAFAPGTPQPAPR